MLGYIMVDYLSEGSKRRLSNLNATPCVAIEIEQFSADLVQSAFVAILMLLVLGRRPGYSLVTQCIGKKGGSLLYMCLKSRGVELK